MGTPIQLPRSKTLLLMSLVVAFAGAPLQAQTDSASLKNPDAAGPAFEVAVIRPTNLKDDRRAFGAGVDASGRYQASSQSLESLVWMAYQDGPAQQNVIEDHTAPKWVASEQFDIQAKIGDPYMAEWSKLSVAQRNERIKPMLRQLLAVRFHLKLRTELRNTPVYLLMQAKGGARVKEVAPPPPSDGDPTKAIYKWMADHPGEPYGGSILCSGNTCTAHAVSMRNAIGQISMSSQADRIVIDQTGLKGFYDFSFSLVTDPDEPPMHAVEQDLGMKFEPRSIPIKTSVIESADKPTLDGGASEMPASPKP